MIDRNETIELDSLFELRIQIQEADGTSHQAASLDEIGSTGTGMTAKTNATKKLTKIDNRPDVSERNLILSPQLLCRLAK